MDELEKKCNLIKKVQKDLSNNEISNNHNSFTTSGPRRSRQNCTFRKKVDCDQISLANKALTDLTLRLTLSLGLYKVCFEFFHIFPVLNLRAEPSVVLILQNF
jgi:hypothetical protein